MQKQPLPRLAVLIAAAATLAACDTRPEAELVTQPGGARAAVGAGVTPHPRNARALFRGPSLSRSGSLAAAAFSPAIIGNGVVQLGVNPEGHLNVPGGALSTGSSPTNWVGVRYLPTQSEATAPGCLCEGWGVGDAATGISGYANVDSDGVENLEVESFVATATTAISTVIVRRPDNGQPWLRVVHDYHPAPATPNLYEVAVTVTNLSTSIVDLRYRRVMDWDIAPNTFNEYVTVQGAAGAASVLYVSNDGFATANPLGWRSSLGFTGDFVDAGPSDHGVLFDFGFGPLSAGASRTFLTFYGAAGTEDAAELALAQAGAEMYSFGQADYDGTWTPAPYAGANSGTFGATTGQPHTFIFAFRSVGSPPIFTPLDIVPYITPSPLSLTRTDLIQVWIASTATFNATRLVPGSATLGNQTYPDATIVRRADGSPYTTLGDYNRDGRMDIALVFRRSSLVSAGDLALTTTELVMRASHQDDGLVRATGPVRVVN